MSTSSTEHPHASRAPSPALTLTAAQARRTAIAAQGLHRPRSAGGPINRGHLRRLVERIGVLQIDSVNVLARAHYLPVFARLGAYPTEVLDGAAWPARAKDRQLLESWAHVASLIPVELEPLLRYRQQFMADRWRPRSLLAEHPDFLDRVLEVIGGEGPISAGGVEKILEAPGKGRPGWWEWSATKRICEYLFLSGQTAVAGRRAFERQYDLTDRVLPAAVLAAPTPDPADAKRELVAMAIRHHGIGTAGDIADYYRLRVDDTQRALIELVEAGAVLPVRVTGWKDKAWLDAAAAMPRKAGGQALLCPFDPLIWHRPRTERIFDVHYRIEIYTPQHKRVHGYYVFPLLLGDSLVGRFDLKADRATGRLLVQASWLEPGAAAGPAAAAAADELAEMARWLGLGEVVVMPKGDLARELTAAVHTLPG
ncbi:winged helix-turn-helix domain-containing protein [Nakamurella lactea]|uniref:winged helix-turn-helix domain-containing protein n=1 Tax=Nakamurella lactea TaxID=459515 RepID=UPI0004215D91|nr:crosslink repair DNA glycosylase YcaQ family protein [Nakamurella lactea]